MQRMGTAVESRDNGLGETEWVPMAEGLWKFELARPVIELSGFKNEDGSDKYRVSVRVALTQEEYERAQTETEHSSDQQVSGRCWYRVGMGAKFPLGFYRDGQYVSTKLADLWCAAFGKANVNQARKFLAEGGSPDYTGCSDYADQVKALEDWLGWLEGCQVYFTVTHSADKKVAGRVWANPGAPLPVGSLPGQPEPDYQAFGKGKLRAIVSGSSLPTPAEQGVAEGAAEAQAAKAQANQEKVAAATQQANARTYNEIFGDDAE
jgi:hypothetical protein